MILPQANWLNLTIVYEKRRMFTTCENRRVLIKFNNMNLPHMTCKSSRGHTSRDIPQEDGAIAATRSKFAVIMRAVSTMSLLSFCDAKRTYTDMESTS
jgi:hypothetical protein